MDPSFLRKVEKAKDYALQRDRVSFSNCTVRFKGDNGDHTITYDNGEWGCSCDFLIGRETCTHIMALEMMFDGMVSPVEQTV